MIIDSHCHAWTVWPYDTTVPDPDSRGRVEQLLFEMDRNGVDRAVVVCARIDQNPDNNEYVAVEAALRPDRLVQFADVDCSWSPEYHAPGAADRLRAAVDQFSLAGFTHYLGEENDGWLRSEEGIAFFAAAAELDQIASISMSPVWLDDLRHIAAASPTLPILLHHQARVHGVDGLDSPQLRALIAAAAEPNLAIKASGFYYGSRDQWDFPYHEQIEVFQRIYEAFGARRLAWGSDFPVSPWVASTYAQTLEVVRKHCAFLPTDDLAWILGGTIETLLETRRPVVIA
jgi:L-fuconolactonase